jgi:hypothetical protein
MSAAASTLYSQAHRLPHAWHGALYGRPGAAFAAGAAVGAIGVAAATAPYYYGPRCGYYPYPPCYSADLTARTSGARSWPCLILVKAGAKI